MPDVEDVLAILRGDMESLPVIRKEPQLDEGGLPVLVIHGWCPFTSPATELWHEAAKRTGTPLRTVSASSKEGDSVIHSHRVRGVPCLVSEGGEVVYGMRSLPEAMQLLESGQKS